LTAHLRACCAPTRIPLLSGVWAGSNDQQQQNAGNECDDDDGEQRDTSGRLAPQGLGPSRANNETV